MSTKTARYSGYFSPSELTDIERVVKDVCLDVNDDDGSHTSAIAGRAIKMYQNGLSDLNVMRNRLLLISRRTRPL